jgi:hypothetical protein
MTAPFRVGLHHLTQPGLELMGQKPFIHAVFIQQCRIKTTDNIFMCECL